MLDICLRAEVADADWHAAKHRFDGELLDELGGAPAALPSSEDRKRDRQPLYGRAIAHRGKMRLGVRLRDISYAGIGIYSPLQLFPKEELAIDLQSDLRFNARVCRCRRHAKNHYVCGLEFVPSVLSVAQFRDLQRRLSD